MLKYIVSIIIIYFFIGIILFIFQRKIIFNVSGIPKNPIFYGLKNIEVVKIVTTDNIGLLAWFSKPKLDQPTLLYFHGNSFDIGERSHRIEKYIKNGWGVLLVAYRGYSGNKGLPTEKNLYNDADSSVKWLNEKKLIYKKNIILYGESLGTGVALEIASRHIFKSLVLEAPFTSIYDIAIKRYKIYPFRYLILDKFDNISKINKISYPILIISGKRDEIIPHIHSVKLLLKANDPKDFLFIDEAMHNNLYDFGIEKKIIEFNKYYAN